jgi:superfamily I DNA/RNA helicase
MRTLKIYGPPGTGKTHELLRLFRAELLRVRPDRIAFMTFTRAARREALLRTDRAEGELPYLRTIHSLCYRALRLARGQVVGAPDLRRFGKTIGMRLSGQTNLVGEELLEKVWQPPALGDLFLQLHHLSRHREVELEVVAHDAPPNVRFQELRFFAANYEAWKKREELLDYTDLLARYLAEGQPLPIEAIFVDEAQDLSPLQWRVVEQLGARAARRYVAGDDDQAIFTWAGASARAFNALAADEERVLPRSYRVPRAIHKVAQRIVERIVERKRKEFQPRDAEGEFRLVSGLEESLFQQRGSTYVLFRNYHRGIKLAQQLEELGAPFAGTASPLTDDVRATIYAWTKLARDEAVTTAQARLLVRFSSPDWLQPGLREDALNRRTETRVRRERLFLRAPTTDDCFRALTGIPGGAYLLHCQERYGLGLLIKPRIELLSIHQSKGREAANVVLDLELARRTYDHALRAPDDEHRVFYVAVTRARERLAVLQPTDVRAYEI